MRDAVPRRRWARLALVLLGLIAPQVLLFGQSLAGRKLLLPVDILAPYVPPAPELARQRPDDAYVSDRVYVYEPWRRFTIDEVRAGRVPLWNPYIYCGAPLIAANQSAVFSPLRALDYLFPSPVTHAWSQLLKSLVAGLGAYLVLRRVTRVGFWPAAFAAWCYPLVGFMMLWQGFPMSVVAAWLPWAILATDAAARRPLGWGGPGLAVVTASALVAGHADSAAHLLLVSGAFFLWRWAGDHLVPLVGPARRRFSAGPALGSAAAVLAGWALGFLISAPQNLPTLEYLRFSNRLAAREARARNLFVTGPASSPLLVLPYAYGTDRHEGMFTLPSGSRRESPAAAYAGLVITLVLAPLALGDRRRRGAAAFWLAVGLLALVGVLQVPWLEALFRLPLMKLLANHRLGFVWAWAILNLAALGLEVLAEPAFAWRQGYLAAVALLAGTLVWCAVAAMRPPHYVATNLPRLAAATSSPIDWPQWFRSRYLEGVAAASLALGMWGAVAACAEGARRRAGPGRGDPARGAGASRRPGLERSTQANRPIARRAAAVGGNTLAAAGQRSAEAPGAAEEASAARLVRRRWLAVALAAAALGELIYNGWDVNAQCDPAFYYPPSAALATVARRADAQRARICALNTCLPVNVNQMYGLREVRGYDAVDPQPIVDLLRLCTKRGEGTKLGEVEYAVTMYFVPFASPLLDMLAVRYRLLPCGAIADETPVLRTPQFDVYETTASLPRAYVPRRVVQAADEAAVLAALDDPSFDPAETALVSQPLAISQPPPGQTTHAPRDERRPAGTVLELRDPSPCEVRLEVAMPRDGLVVLADAWYPGWKAQVDGREVPVVRTNHALRGVVVPEGRHRLVFRYSPASFAWGLGLAGAGLAGCLAWLAAGWRAAAGRGNVVEAAVRRARCGRQQPPGAGGARPAAPRAGRGAP